MKFTEQQPKNGERVLTCSHRDDEFKPHHFFKLEPHVDFGRPDGSTGRATWAVVCNSCFRSNADSPMDMITGDALWRGDEPAIYDNSN
jgi:hypothetical protein